MIARQNAPPSTLADVLKQVIDAFDAMGNGTPIMIGRHYLEDFGAGSGPRILFVPERKGKLEKPIEMGRPGSFVHSCEVYVRGDESGDDVNRFRTVYELGDLVIGCIWAATSGRVTWGDAADDSPVDVDAYGVDLAMSFTFARDVAHSAKRWSLPAATEDASAASPGVPPGQPGTVVSVDAVATPQEA